MKKILKTAVNQALKPLHIEVRSIYQGGRMFPESLKVLKTVLSPIPHTIIDVGVADGTPWLYDAFPAAQNKYVLIEAHPAYSEAVDRLGKEMNAVVEKVFCGDHIGTESFIARREAAKATKYSRAKDNDRERVNVPTKTLDAIARDHTLAGPYILKIDVEGAELDVLRGATDVLSTTHAIIIETPIISRMKGASSIGEIVSFLYAHNFALFDMVEMSYDPRNNFLNLANGIFIRQDNPLWTH